MAHLPAVRLPETLARTICELREVCTCHRSSARYWGSLMTTLKSKKAAGGALALVLVLQACGRDTPPQAALPPEVRVVVVRLETRENVVEMPGRVEAVRSAQVRAQVDGIVQRVLYQEGSDVKEGQRLFLIDPRESRAAFTAARAALARAEATAANAKQNVDRYKGLVDTGVISRQQYDAALAELRTAQADVAQARAQVEGAKLDLDNTTVTAPIAGRAGRSMVTEGALVSAASATLLTIIEQLDPIHVNFSASSGDVLRAQRDIAAGRLKMPELKRVEVSLLLEDGSAYPQKGHLNFMDLAVDEQTGTTALRAEFPNPRRILVPGQFVRARVDAGVRPDAVVIPQRAVTVTPKGGTVMVVGADDVAATRAIELGSLQGSDWIVLDGLKAGERVIVDGLQKVRPGQPVTVTTADAAKTDDAGR